MTTLEWIALSLCLVAACGILLARDWRWLIAWLAILYLGAFWLVQTSWPIPLAAVKLVTGWMACVLLALAHLYTGEGPAIPASWPQGRLFRAFAVGLILIVSYASAVSLRVWLGMGFPSAWGSLLLIGLGLLLTGITTQPFRLIIGLLTALAGFEIIYAAVESSALVTGLLAVINLGLALAGAYFLVHQGDQLQS